MRCGVRGRRATAAHAGVHGEGPTQGCGGQGTRGAHFEHVAHARNLGRVEAERLVEHKRVREHSAHVCDAGRVEAERLVERERALPSRKGGVRCGARCGPGGPATDCCGGRYLSLGVGWRRGASGVHGEGPTDG